MHILNCMVPQIASRIGQLHWPPNHQDVRTIVIVGHQAALGASP